MSNWMRERLRHFEEEEYCRSSSNEKKKSQKHINHDLVSSVSNSLSMVYLIDKLRVWRVLKRFPMRPYESLSGFHIVTATASPKRNHCSCGETVGIKMDVIIDRDACRIIQRPAAYWTIQNSGVTVIYSHINGRMNLDNTRNFEGKDWQQGQEREEENMMQKAKTFGGEHYGAGRKSNDCTLKLDLLRGGREGFLNLEEKMKSSFKTRSTLHILRLFSVQ
ncbi:hypothetical protein K435DRAFT_806182 [Dendrothele bispora CBS 962.96]|uniref:Uncharacterized protein n=1 Tax=Dendrothele bispora (strain CBS 962.96) TaxID=1314807 RepID=A0A4S8L932_DENBC|nr:hypothetical protein K435DRAFT_806182 [Dendrothele bispora CBS 962.96]